MVYVTAPWPLHRDLASKTDGETGGLSVDEGALAALWQQHVQVVSTIRSPRDFSELDIVFPAPTPYCACAS